MHILLNSFKIHILESFDFEYDKEAGILKKNNRSINVNLLSEMPDEWFWHLFELLKREQEIYSECDGKSSNDFNKALEGHDKYIKSLIEHEVNYYQPSEFGHAEVNLISNDHDIDKLLFLFTQIIPNKA